MPDLAQAVFAVGRAQPGGLVLLGTAFSIADGKAVSCLHVTGGDETQLVLVVPRHESLDEYQDTTDTRVHTVPVTIGLADPVHDLCVLSGEFSGGTQLPLGGADDVSPGHPVVTLGYPHANAGRLVLTRYDTTVGARVLIENLSVTNKHLVLNVQATPGQSGGPVLDPASGRVVAVLAGSYAPGGGGQISLGGVDPATLHTTTQAVSAEYLPGAS